MKILHVGKFYSPIEGGIEAINKIVVETLRGHSQRIITFNKGHNTIEEDVDATPITRSATSGIINSQPLSFRYFWDLRRILKNYRPDIVHFHYPNPLVAFYLMLLLKKTTKLIVHWHSDVVAQRVMAKIISPLEKYLLKKATVVIATSEDYKNYSNLLRSCKEKVVIIPCSINERNFVVEQSDISKITTIKDEFNNLPIVLFVGRHVEYKGLKYLLEAEKYVTSDCVFVIGGAGPLTEELKAKYLSERIKWIGRIPDSELKYYYNSAEILAFPSITRNEAFGVVLAEAMYCGKPSVTFTIEGSGVNWVSPHMVSGLEVENGNVIKFAEAIDTLLSNGDLRKELGKNGHERVLKLFSREVVSGQYKKLYSQIERGEQN